MFLILESIVTSIRTVHQDNVSFDSLFIRLRIALMLVVVLVNGIDNALFMVVIATTNLQKRLFICWGLRSMSFLLFFLNIMNDPRLFNAMDSFDLIYRAIFYGILVINSLFFLLFMLLVVFLSIVLMFFPVLRQRFAILEQFNDLLLGELNNQAAPRDPMSRPLNEQELDEMRSVEQNARSSGNSCSICLLEIFEKDRIVELENCKHRFHSGCIKLWLRTKPECPLCRVNVRQAAAVSGP
jgi:hypothetical protein